jgi:metal-responsive CopG/Arc/MetJ family transcriptional regulator
MKTAISIEDGLLLEADLAAQTLGLSRSRLFSLAVGDFLKRHRQNGMLKQLNDVYAKELDTAEKHLLTAMKAKAARTVTARW